MGSWTQHEDGSEHRTPPRERSPERPRWGEGEHRRARDISETPAAVRWSRC